MQDDMIRDPSEQELHNEMLAAYGGEEGLAAYEEYQDECEKEELARLAAGGLTTCPTCKHRSVRHHVRPTRQYGGGYDTFSRCETPGCDYADICV